MRATLLVVLVACGNSGEPSSDANGGGDGQSANGLSDRYPGDVGIGGDPAVIWFEPFDLATVAEVTARYDQAQSAGMELDADHPPNSTGNSMRLTAGGNV